MEDKIVFYCPYDLAIQTMDAIWESKKKQIADLKDQGFTDKEIDDMMSL